MRIAIADLRLQSNVRQRLTQLLKLLDSLRLVCL